MTTDKKLTGYVKRFTVGERLYHWCHGVCFLLLLFTGLAMLSLAFRGWTGIIGGMDVSRNMHKVVAVIFTAGMILGLLIGEGGRRVRSWISDVIHFDKDDFAHAKNFVIEFLGGHKPFPPQGKFNGGEKLNSALTIGGTLCIAISGYIMWFAPSMPQWLVQWAYPIHAGFALLMSAVLIAHLYLGILHPDSNQALKGMFNGYVPAKFAYEHYEKWFNALPDKDRVDSL